jgi:hypothetical protein
MFPYLRPKTTSPLFQYSYKIEADCLDPIIEKAGDNQETRDMIDCMDGVFGNRARQFEQCWEQHVGPSSSVYGKAVKFQCRSMFFPAAKSLVADCVVPGFLFVSLLFLLIWLFWQP